MARRFGFQHRGTKRWLASHPHVGPFATTDDKEEAVKFTKAEAELLLSELEPFDGAWMVKRCDAHFADEYVPDTITREEDEGP